MSTFLKIEQDVSTFEVSENLGIFLERLSTNNSSEKLSIFLERLYMYGGGYFIFSL